MAPNIARIIGNVFFGKIILNVGFYAVNDLVYLFRGTVDSGGDFDGG